LREKISSFGEIPQLLADNGELRFVHGLKDYAPLSLLWKKNPKREAALVHLQKVQELVMAIPDDSFTAESIKVAVWNYAEAEGKGDVLWPLRMALTGQDKSPDPFTSAFILGREETLNRIHLAIKKLS
jgi:glutamyl/glutaminyl-tRNA synthetase